MNKLIKDLLIEAGGEYGGEYPTTGQTIIYVDEVDYEKFAELIIKEYEKLLPEICPWNQATEEGPMKGWHVQFVARKHFGVEL